MAKKTKIVNSVHIGAAKKSTSELNVTIKRRNPLALNPLLKKSHAHSKSKKAERAKDKQELKKALKDP